MKKIHFLFLSLLSLSLIYSCDKVDKDNIIDNSGEFPWLGKKVLIEDFTGAKCPNCPDASTELHNLEELYSDKIIGIAIHAGSFAEPNSTFSTDFRTEGGNELTDFFGPDGFPIGMVNRQGYPENVLLSYTDWAAKVTEQLTEAPSIELSITEANGQITVEARRLSDDNNNLKLVVCITEDKIVDKQIDGQTLIEDYEHNHVLRKIVNGTWGTSIDLSNTTDRFPFDYSLDDNWVRSNCNVIAFVYDDSNKEILQAEKIHLTE